MTNKLMVQWVDMEDGGGLYFRLKDGRAINEVLADTMRALSEIHKIAWSYLNGDSDAPGLDEIQEIAYMALNPNKDTDNG